MGTSSIFGKRGGCSISAFVRSVDEAFVVKSYPPLAIATSHDRIPRHERPSNPCDSVSPAESETRQNASMTSATISHVIVRAMSVLVLPCVCCHTSLFLASTLSRCAQVIGPLST